MAALGCEGIRDATTRTRPWDETSWGLEGITCSHSRRQLWLRRAVLPSLEVNQDFTFKTENPFRLSHNLTQHPTGLFHPSSPQWNSSWKQPLRATPRGQPRKTRSAFKSLGQKGLRVNGEGRKPSGSFRETSFSTEGNWNCTKRLDTQTMNWTEGHIGKIPSRMSSVHANLNRLILGSCK